MDPQMTKEHFLHLVRTEHAKWEALLTQIPESRMTQPGVAGDAKWSVKDLIAHVAWYESEIVTVLQTRALRGSELWGVSVEERHNGIWQQSKDRPLEEIRERAGHVFDALLQGLETLAEEDLHDPHRFVDMPLAWLPWRVFATSTYEHYQYHIAQVQAWLREQQEQPASA
jgi:hypothetical protein